MDVNDRRQMEEKVEAFAARARRIFLHCDNEEQTKISLINPYLELLGYDVRDPVICRLEFSADIGKTGEKVDYAILQDGTPSILIEAKAATLDLRAYSVPTQLQRYFMATRANFAVLTNGLLWHWYRSTAGNNMLETTPFLVHDVRTPGKLERNWLMSISGPAYDSSRALTQAEGEGMNSAFLGWIEEARRQPSDEFLRMLIKSTKLGIATASRIKRARESFVSTFGYYIDRETDSLFEAARGHRQEVETQEKIEKEQRDHSEHEVAAPETLQPDGVEQSLDLGDGGTPITAGLACSWRSLAASQERQRHADCYLPLSRFTGHSRQE